MLTFLKSGTGLDEPEFYKTRIILQIYTFVSPIQVQSNLKTLLFNHSWEYREKLFYYSHCYVV
jgi:hypothetical protein